jgi:hypothetical protein
MLLPVLLSVPGLRRGSRLAVLPVLICLGQTALWFLYYATDWFSNPGIGGALIVGVAPSVLGTLIALVAWVQTQHRDAPVRERPAAASPTQGPR